MNLRRESTQAIITLSEASLLGAGGEARVYALPQEPLLVAKVYHKPSEQRARKLRAMLANPPHDPQAGTAIIWPVDLLRTTDAQQQVVGFLMPRVTQMRRVMDLYHPKTRRQECPLFNYLYLHRTGRNLAAAMKALHAHGYVIGDVNESNVLVSETALVTLVDADSFQVRDGGAVYRCAVGKAEFTPPELQGRIFAAIDRAPEHDLFGLAVLLFQLLMEGTHPFAGVYTGSAEPPPLESRISAGHFSYGAGKQAPYRPMPVAPPFGILHPRLRQLFVQAFHTGHQQPQARPDAQTWADALKEAEEALRTCASNSQHRFGNHLANCPWCERTQKLGGRDPFPSPQAVQKREHLQPAPRKVAPPRPPAYRAAPRPRPIHYPQPVIFQSYQPPAPPPSKWASVKQGLGGLFRSWWVLVVLINLLRLATCDYSSQPARVPYTTGTPPPPVSFKGLPSRNGKVNALAFAPDGRLIAVACGDKTAKLFAVQSGKLQRALTGYSDAVSAVAFSPDGKLLVTGGYDQTMRWWNVYDGSQRLSVKAHDGPVSSIAVAPDGLTVASGSFDQSLKLWDVRYGALKNNLGGHTGAIYSICYSAYDALASGSRDGSINVRNGQDGILSRIIIASDTEVISESYGAVGAIAFSPKGDLVAGALHDGTLKLWWLSTGALHYSLMQTEASYTIAFAPDGKTFVTGNADGEINYFQTLPGRRLKSFQAHQGAVHSVVFAPDGRTLASGGADGQVKIWTAGADDVLHTFLVE